MSTVQDRSSRSTVFSRILGRSRRIAPYLLLPGALVAIMSSVAFRHTAMMSLPPGTLSDPLHIPAGWAPPPVPADNPITSEKFVLGRQLFFERGLSGDDSVSCGSCHNPKYSFTSGVGARPGAFGHSSNPARNVPRLLNLAYDSVYTWDGHLHTLEQQVGVAIVKRGDFEADTNMVKSRLAKNPAYRALFTQAFGSSEITIDRIQKAIATFERCLISGNSPYDRYLNGDVTAMTPSAIAGMKLFFDTTKTNCSSCHNNVTHGDPNCSEQIFSDNNYYRSGTFDPPPGHREGGYSLDPELGDPGRAAVTKDSGDLGKFRTPTLRNVAFRGPYGANGSVSDLLTVIERYVSGGSNAFNQDPRIHELKLSPNDQVNLLYFLQSLSDTSFVTNPEFQNPGVVTASVDDHLVADNMSVYPNPATSFVTITSPDLDGAVEASVISSRGTTMWHHSVYAENGRMQLDLEKLQSGTYTVTLRSATKQKMCKIVLEH